MFINSIYEAGRVLFIHIARIILILLLYFYSRDILSPGDIYTCMAISLTIKETRKKLDPYYVTGFSDGEACFYVCITKSKTYKIGWQVQACFSFGLGKRDRALLGEIQSYFGGVGKIKPQGQTGYQYMVRSLRDLTDVVIPHFDKYPLLSQKQVDFELFKRVVDLMNRLEHLNPAGLQQIINIKALMNLGLSDELKKAFPNTNKSGKRPELLFNPIQDPN